jgi:hypothetical protein
LLVFSQNLKTTKTCPKKHSSIPFTSTESCADQLALQTFCSLNGCTSSKINYRGQVYGCLMELLLVVHGILVQNFKNKVYYFPQFYQKTTILN